MAEIYDFATRQKEMSFETAKPLFEFLLERMDRLQTTFGPTMFSATATSLSMWMRIWTQTATYFRSYNWEGQPEWEALCQRYASYAGKARTMPQPSPQQLSAALVMMALQQPIPAQLRQAVMTVAA